MIGANMATPTPHSVVVAVVVIAALLGSDFEAHAGPLFDVTLSAPGSSAYQDFLSPAPIIQSVSGNDGAFASGLAFGRAQLGSVGTKLDILCSGSPGTAFGFASASFQDEFFPDIVGPGPTGTLNIGFSVHGTFSFSGNQTTFHSAFLRVSNRTTGDTVSLSFPIALPAASGMLQVPVELGVVNDLQVEGSMTSRTSIDGRGHVVLDASNSAEITSVQLFDSQGRFVRDVLLTDSSGNALVPGPAPSAEVPEPASIMLCATGLSFLLSGTLVRRNQRTRHSA